MAADCYAACATCLTDDRWATALQHLQTADMLYKISGFEDRGFTLMKRLAMQLCDSIENRDVFENGLEVYRRIFPKLFEGSNMVMNYDMLETYAKALAQAKKWKELIETKYTIIDHYNKAKQVDHRTRRSFLEIICVQIISEDFYKMEETMDAFFREVGGNPYTFDEYECCAGLKEAAEKQEWYKIDEWLRKP